MNKAKKIVFIIIEAVVPVLIYYLLLFTVNYLLGMALIAISPVDFIKASFNYNFTEFVGAIVTIPFMFWIYCNDRNGRQGIRQYVSTHKIYILPEQIRNAVLAALIVGLFAFAMNVIIPLTPLMGWSKAYATAESALYSGGLGWELASSGFVVPILEELVFRGIVQKRMEKYMSGYMAVIISAAFFGVVHLNLVQFVFAFVLGLVLGLLALKTGHIYPAIIGHMAANIFSLLRTEYEWFPNLLDNNLSTWMIAIGCILIGISLLMIYLKNYRKSTIKH